MTKIDAPRYLALPDTHRFKSSNTEKSNYQNEPLLHKTKALSIWKLL